MSNWDGLCKNHPSLEPDAWFDVEQFEAALVVCGHCPYQRQCLQAAYDNDEQFGVWGGTTPAQRGHNHEEDGRDV